MVNDLFQDDNKALNQIFEVGAIVFVKKLTIEEIESCTHDARVRIAQGCSEVFVVLLH
jgi:hypothetical protein